MKYKFDIYPVEEKPKTSKWYIVMDDYGMWYWSFYDTDKKRWYPDHNIRCWFDLPKKEALAALFPFRKESK